MKRYEGMFIFTDAVKADDVDNAVTAVRAEIEKLGGNVESSTRLGRRSFARLLHKQEGGQYAVITFSLAPDKVTPLTGRYKLMEEVLRVQIVLAEERPVAANAAGGGA